MVSINTMIENSPWNKKIAILRASNGWSQKEAAEKCCTNQKIYWLWETGRSFPRKNSQRAIAMAFGVDQKEIFGHENKKIRVG